LLLIFLRGALLKGVTEMARSIDTIKKLSVVSLGSLGALGVSLAQLSLLAAPSGAFADDLSPVSQTSADTAAPSTPDDGSPTNTTSTNVGADSGAPVLAAPAADGTAITEAADEDDDLGDVAGRFIGTYTGIFYGPSISKPTSFQPTEDGSQDPDRPVMLKNFAGLGYNITDHVRVTPTAYWQWLPTGGGAYSVQDPFVKLSDDSIASFGGFNLYGDVRYHAPISNFSQAADITGSYQSVQVATYVPEGSRWMFSLLGSERVYTYGPKGYGNDLELYIAPNVGYQVSPKVQLTMLYETNLVHEYGTNPGTIEGDGTDFQPGVSIDITNTINFHPYLSIYPSSVSLASTGVGALLYWQAF
jgi:hypothetical protein